MKAPSLLLSLLLAACSSAADPPAQIAEDDAGAPSRSDGGGETVIPQKDAAPDAPPCIPGAANFPQCRGGVRHVFSIGCSTRRAPGCFGEGGFADGAAQDVLVDVYPAVAASTVADYNLPAATGVVLADGLYKYVFSSTEPGLLATGTRDGLARTVGSEAGRDPYVRESYTLDRATMSFSAERLDSRYTADCPTQRSRTSVSCIGKLVR